VALILDVEDDLPLVHADPDRVAQVLHNLLSNALRYTPDGDSVSLSAGMSEGQVGFTVRDSGPGIPEEDLSRIFSRFYRGDRARQRHDGGAGLGLAIARSLVEQHGESQAEQGLAGDRHGGLSEMGLWAIGGLIEHGKALVAITSPTSNSYRRLVPGYEAPVNLAYSSRNRSVAIRIPMIDPSPASRRIEFRCPDPSCNPYFAFSAMLMAAVDGIKNQIDPGEALDRNIYELPPQELARIPSTPGSLEEALEELERDHEFLLQGDVFTQEVIDAWINYKREHEVMPVKLRPHPHEFDLYFDL
jgi:glutamine synthetase